MEYLGRHPIFSLDEDVKVFYTEPDEERFNDYKKSRTPMVVSEFYNHPKASTAKDCLPAGAAETLHMVYQKKKNVLFPIFTNRFITRSVTSSPHSLPTSTSLSRAPKPRGSVLKEKPMTIPNSALPLSIAVVFCY